MRTERAIPTQSGDQRGDFTIDLSISERSAPIGSRHSTSRTARGGTRSQAPRLPGTRVVPSPGRTAPDTVRFAVVPHSRGRADVANQRRRDLSRILVVAARYIRLGRRRVRRVAAKTSHIESAVNQAKGAAAGKSVGVHGADTIQQLPECRPPRRNQRRHRGGSSWLRSSTLRPPRCHASRPWQPDGDPGRRRHTPALPSTQGVVVLHTFSPAVSFLDTLRDSTRETLANLSISGHLRCFSDQPVAEIVQCGEPTLARRARVGPQVVSSPCRSSPSARREHGTNPT